MSDKTTITIKEFRMWLEGVEEMQDDDWVPDAKQWARIRAKIDSVVESTAPQAMVTYNSQPAPSYGQPAGGYAHEFPSTFDIPPTFPTGPTLPSGASLGGLNLTKTPDIDTTSGNYQSKFG